MRVALDLLGGGLLPVDGMLAAHAALESIPALEILIVGPESAASRDAQQLSTDPSRLSFQDSATCVDDLPDPVGAVRATRNATVRLAHRSVRDGAADGCVTASAPSVAVAAATFSFGALPGVTQPSFALLVGPVHAPVVLLDAGATTQRSVDALLQLALAGPLLARAVLGIACPRVGMLEMPRALGGRTPTTSQADAIAAHLATAGFGSEETEVFVGSVDPETISLGSSLGGCDVVISDAWSAQLALAAARGGAAAARSAIMGADGTQGDLQTGVDEQIQQLFGRGGFVLGVNGVSVVSSSPTVPSMTAAIALAARAAESTLVASIADAMAGLVASRRAEAGYGPLA